MKRSTALWASVVLSAFLLVILSGVFSAAAKARAAVDGQDPTANQALVDQQAAYAQAIEQANQQLLQAQAMIDSLQSGGSQAEAAGVAVSAEQAVQLAQEAAANGAQLNGQAELVDFEGTVAYEVPFDQGKIYIDATTGEVLYNGTQSVVPAPISPEQAAQIAANYMGNSNVYRVELGYLNGQEVYRVKFVNGDAVFVGIYGDLQMVRLAASGSSSTSQSGQNNHEEGEHEGNDD